MLAAQKYALQLVCNFIEISKQNQKKLFFVHGPQKFCTVLGMRRLIFFYLYAIFC